MTTRTTTPVGPEITPKPGELPGNGRTYKTVGIGDDTVYVSHAIMRRGANANGKTWCRFETQSMDVASWRSGRLRVYQSGRTKKGRYVYDQTTFFIRNAMGDTDYYHGYATGKEDLTAALAEKTGMSLPELVLKEYPLAADIPAGPGVTPLLASRDVGEFTRKFFGKSRYRKDLVRGVGRMAWLPNGGTEHLKLLKAFSTFTPTDWIARYLEEIPAPNVYTTPEDLHGRTVNIVQVRKALRTATPKQIRRLVTVGQMPMRDVMDSMRTLEEIWNLDSSYRLDALRFGDWKELHDLLPVELRKMRHRNQAVEYPKKAQKLIGTHGEYEIIGTLDTWTLSEWGRTMNNCIGGYGSAAVSQRSLLFAVIKDGKMLANMEIAPDGTIRQLVGKHNGRLEAKDDLAIRAAVHEVWFVPNMQIAFDRAGATFAEIGAAAQNLANFQWRDF